MFIIASGNEESKIECMCTYMHMPWKDDESGYWSGNRQLYSDLFCTCSILTLKVDCGVWVGKKYCSQGVENIFHRCKVEGICCTVHWEKVLLAQLNKFFNICAKNSFVRPGKFFVGSFYHWLSYFDLIIIFQKFHVK